MIWHFYYQFMKIDVFLAQKIFPAGSKTQFRRIFKLDQTDRILVFGVEVSLILDLTVY